MHDTSAEISLVHMMLEGQIIVMFETPTGQEISSMSVRLKRGEALHYALIAFGRINRGVIGFDTTRIRILNYNEEMKILQVCISN